MMKNPDNETTTFNGKKVLILEGYCRQVLPFLKAFKDLGCETTILCGSKWDCGYWSRYADHKIVDFCEIDRYEGTTATVRKLVKSGEYDIVIAPFDFSAKILSYNKDELSEYAEIIANDRDVFDHAHDKLSVMHICAENKLPHPYTVFDAQNIDDVKQAEITYPVFIKPRESAGAKGCHIFGSFEELKEGIENYNIDVSDYIIQEYIPSDSRLVSQVMYIDRNGEVKSAYQYESVRFFPLQGGTGTMNVTINRPDIQETCTKLAKIIGLKGLVAFDIMIDSRDDTGKVLEINPRMLACAALGFYAGINQARLILEDTYCQNVTPQTEYRTGVGMRMLQTDILWFLTSPNRFHAKPSWFSWRDTYEQTFRWSDPLPWFAFLLRGLKKLKKELKKRC